MHILFHFLFVRYFLDLFPFLTPYYQFVQNLFFCSNFNANNFTGIVIAHISLTVKVDCVKGDPEFAGALDLPAHIFFHRFVVAPVRKIIFQGDKPADDRQGNQSEKDAECQFFMRRRRVAS